MDLKLAYLPTDQEENVRPVNIREPQLQLSRDRMNSIELNVNVGDVLAGRTSALDFTGNNVLTFCEQNGLSLIERKKLPIAANETLVNIVRKNYISELEDLNQLSTISVDQ